MPVIDGEINGRKVGILLDTGSSPNLVVRQAAERLNLTLSPAFGHRVQGIAGEAYAESVVIDELKASSVRRNNWRAFVVAKRPQDDDIAVLLGHEFFAGFDVEFDLARHLVSFYQTTGCEATNLAYWTREALEVPVEIRSSVTLDIEVNGRKTTALLDSAAPSILSKSAAADLGIAPESPGVVSAGCAGGLGRREIQVWRAQLDSIAIGNETIERPRILIADLWGDKNDLESAAGLPRRAPVLPEMLLGIDFLRSHRVLVSHTQRKLYFSYLGGTVFSSKPAWPCGRN